MDGRLIEVQAVDCILWCVLRALHQRPSRQSSTRSSDWRWAGTNSGRSNQVFASLAADVRSPSCCWSAPCPAGMKHCTCWRWRGPEYHWLVWSARSAPDRVGTASLWIGSRSSVSPLQSLVQRLMWFRNVTILNYRWGCCGSRGSDSLNFRAEELRIVVSGQLWSGVGTRV